MSRLKKVDSLRLVRFFVVMVRDRGADTAANLTRQPRSSVR